METKICNGIFCDGLERSLDEFDVVKGKIWFQCRKCFKEKKRIRSILYYKNNKEKEKIRHALYIKNNKEKEKMRHELYNKNNKEIIYAKQKNYRQKNKQKIHDKVQSKLQNQDKYLKYLIVQLRAKDKKHNRDCDIDYEYVTELIKKQNNKCVYSGATLIWRNRSGIFQGTIDRISAKLGHVKGNCQLVTVPINHFKTDLTHDKFMKLIDLIKNGKNNNDDIDNEFITFDNLTSKAKKKIRSMFKDMKNRELERKQKIKTNELIANGSNKKEAQKQAKKEITKDDIKFEIDYNFFDELRRKCNDRCALTNIKIKWMPNCISTGSIDRIDSKKGYEKDNVQITAWYVNCMKKDLSDDVAKQILEQIIAHNSKENNSKENDLNENNSENNSEENSSEENNLENSSEDNNSTENSN